ncbi:MAG: adenylate/guanylate cyclase domain-containing protein [Geminicoccales bacterium]
MERRLAAIMAADVVGYSKLMGKDEAGTHLALQAHLNDFIAPTINAHRGSIIKLMGDGILAEFRSVVDALEAAIAIQHGMAERNEETSSERRIQLRVGLNLGDIIAEKDDIFGDGVNIAARLESLAEPGGICISDSAFAQVKNKVDVSFQNLGAQRVKNIAEPIRTYRVAFSPDSDESHILFRPKDWSTTLWWVVAVCIAVTCAGLISGLYWFVTDVEQVAQTIPTAPKLETNRPSILVLPFDNFDADPARDYFSDGFTEDLIADLSKISSLLVVSRNAAFQYKGKAVDPQRLGNELGVRYVLEGSVRSDGERVRINAQLIKTSDGFHLWAERYDRDMAEVFALQDELADQIATALEIRLTDLERKRLTQRFTDSAEAYDLYLKGYDVYRRKTKDNTYEARDLFERSVEIDPKFAAAIARLAHTYFHAWNAGWEGPESFERAVAMAKDAVAARNDSPEAHDNLGFMLLWQRKFDEAIAEIERAIELEPSYAKAYADLASVLIYAGRAEEALSKIEQAVALEPYFWSNYHEFLFGIAHQALGNLEEAIAYLERSIDGNRRFHPAWRQLAAAHAEVGNLEQAKSAATTLLELQPSFSVNEFINNWPVSDTTFVERMRNGLLVAGVTED